MRSARYEPATSDMHFILGLTEAGAVYALPTILDKLSNLAPSIKLSVKSVTDIDSYEEFKELEIDILVGYYPKIPESIPSKTLLVHEQVCVVDKNNPKVKDKLNSELFINLPHLVLTHGKSRYLYNGKSETYNLIFKKHNLRKLTYVEVPYIMLGVALIENSEYISIVPKMVAEKFSEKFNLKLFKLPKGIDIPKINIKMFWTPENDNYQPNKWIRKIIYESYTEVFRSFQNS